MPGFLLFSHCGFNIRFMRAIDLVWKPGGSRCRPHWSARLPVTVKPYMSQPALLSRKRLDGRVGGIMLCFMSYGQVGLQANRYHVSHAAVSMQTCTLSMLHQVWFDSKQHLFRLEVVSLSTRSRLWFYSKYDSPRAIPAWDNSAQEAGELLWGCLKVDGSFALAVHIRKLYQPEGLLIRSSCYWHTSIYV